jgi:hypothetical protein
MAQEGQGIGGGEGREGMGWDGMGWDIMETQKEVGLACNGSCPHALLYLTFTIFMSY